MITHHFLVGLTIVLCFFKYHVVADFPNFISGFGLTVTNFSKVNNQLYDVIVQSGEVKDDQKIRILLPPDYTTSGASRRYPVLYLLHGAHDNAESWTTQQGTAQETLGNLSLITVMPNGDRFGWYTNWVFAGSASPQNWRTFHNEQLIPWIDLNLRTVGKKEGRAIAGLSMGGYGAIRYAEVYPQLFIYTASFSGTLNLRDVAIQAFVVSTETSDRPRDGPFGPPFIMTNTSGWVLQDAVTHAEPLRSVNIAIYTGKEGIPEVDIQRSAIHMHAMLNSLNISHFYDDYGNGKSIGHGCHGKHEWPCWDAALIDVAPRIMAVLQQEF